MENQKCVENFFTRNNHYFYNDGSKNNPTNEHRTMLFKINPEAIGLEYKPLGNKEGLFTIDFEFHPDILICQFIDDVDTKGIGLEGVIKEGEPVTVNNFVFNLHLDYCPREPEIHAIKRVKIQPLDSQEVYTFQNIGRLIGTNDKDLWLLSYDYEYDIQCFKERLKSDCTILERLLNNANKGLIINVEDEILKRMFSDGQPELFKTLNNSHGDGWFSLFEKEVREMYNPSWMMKSSILLDMIESESDDNKKEIYRVYNRILRQTNELESYERLKSNKEL